MVRKAMSSNWKHGHMDREPRICLQVCMWLNNVLLLEGASLAYPERCALTANPHASVATTHLRFLNEPSDPPDTVPNKKTTILDEDDMLGLRLCLGNTISYPDTIGG